MNAYFYLIIILLSALFFALILKVFLLKKSAKEIESQLKEKTAEETNTLIEISSADKDMRSLAASLNDELKTIIELRHKYAEGDEEIKKAVTNISHDLRTPLTAISGCLDLIEKEEKSAQTERYLSTIRNRADAMKTLTEELFRFSVVATAESEINPEEVNISSLVEESLAANYTLLKDKGIEPEITLADSIVRVTDRNLLLRVFGNIISNAAKYSDGDLVITAAEDGTVNFSNTARELSNIQTARLFDRFYTVNDARKSTGLGLSIAKEITQKLGGKISADYDSGVLTISVVL